MPVFWGLFDLICSSRNLGAWNRKQEAGGRGEEEQAEEEEGSRFARFGRDEAGCMADGRC